MTTPATSPPSPSGPVRRSLEWALVLASLALLAGYLSLAPYGFWNLDEPLLLGGAADWPGQLALGGPSVTHFGAILHPLLALCGGHLALYRAVSALALWGAGAILALAWSRNSGLEDWRDNASLRERLLLACWGGNGALWYYQVSLTPSYSWVVYVALFLLLAAALEAVRDRPPVTAAAGRGWAAAMAFGAVVAGFSRPPAGVLFILAGLAWLAWAPGRRRLLPVFLASVAAAYLVLSWLAGPGPVGTITSALQALTMLQDSGDLAHSNGVWPVVKELLRLEWLGVLYDYLSDPWFSLPMLGAAGWLGFRRRDREPGAVAEALAWMLPGFLAVAMVRGKLSLWGWFGPVERMPNSQAVWLALLLGLALASLSILAGWRLFKDSGPDRRRLGVVLFMLVLAAGSILGSDVPLGHRAKEVSLVLFLATMTALAVQTPPARRRSLLLAGSLFSLLATVSALSWFENRLAGAVGLATPIRQHRTEVSIQADRFFFLADPETRRYLDEWHRKASAAGLLPGDPLVTLTGNSQLPSLMFKTRPVGGYYLGGNPAWSRNRALAILKRNDPECLGRSAVFCAGINKTNIHGTLLAELGYPFPWAYQCVAEVKRPRDPAVEQLWLPPSTLASLARTPAHWHEARPPGPAAVPASFQPLPEPSRYWAFMEPADVGSPAPPEQFVWRVFPWRRYHWRPQAGSATPAWRLWLGIYGEASLLGLRELRLNEDNAFEFPPEARSVRLWLGGPGAGPAALSGLEVRYDRPEEIPWPGNRQALVPESWIATLGTAVETEGQGCLKFSSSRTGRPAFAFAGEPVTMPKGRRQRLRWSCEGSVPAWLVLSGDSQAGRPARHLFFPPGEAAAIPWELLQKEGVGQVRLSLWLGGAGSVVLKRLEIADLPEPWEVAALPPAEPKPPECSDEAWRQLEVRRVLSIGDGEQKYFLRQQPPALEVARPESLTDGAWMAPVAIEVRATRAWLSSSPDPWMKPFHRLAGTSRTISASVPPVCNSGLFRPRQGTVALTANDLRREFRVVQESPDYRRLEASLLALRLVEAGALKGDVRIPVLPGIPYRLGLAAAAGMAPARLQVGLFSERGEPLGRRTVTGVEEVLFPAPVALVTLTPDGIPAPAPSLVFEMASFPPRTLDDWVAGSRLAAWKGIPKEQVDLAAASGSGLAIGFLDGSKSTLGINQALELPKELQNRPAAFRIAWKGQARNASGQFRMQLFSAKGQRLGEAYAPFSESGECWLPTLATEAKSLVVSFSGTPGERYLLQTLEVSACSLQEWMEPSSPNPKPPLADGSRL